MSSRTDPLSPGSSSAITHREEILDRFEAAWRRGATPRISDSLANNTESDRTDLLRELLRIDCDYRRRAGQTPQLEDYLPEFAGERAVLDEVFANTSGAVRSHELQTDLGLATSATNVSTSDPAPASAEAEPDHFQPGDQFGIYQLERKLGEGGMGAVWKAKHTRLGKTFALKLLPRRFTRDRGLVSRFDREMKAVGLLDHPNIIRATDAGEIQGVHFLVMEYIDGVDVNQYVLQRGPLSVRDACKLINHAARGLGHAHEHGLIHRDIKPTNLFLTKQGQLKILDLGLSRLQGEAPLESSQDPTLTQMGQIMGTPDYMAGEQWDDTHSVDGRADLYALGCTLCFLLTGRPPFGDDAHNSLSKKLSGHTLEPLPDLRAARRASGEKRQRKLDEIPDEVLAIYHRLMAKRPEDRFQTAGELQAALAPILKGAAPTPTLVINPPAQSVIPATETQVSPVSQPGESGHLSQFLDGIASGQTPTVVKAPQRKSRLPQWGMAISFAAVIGLMFLGWMMMSGPKQSEPPLAVDNDPKFSTETPPVVNTPDDIDYVAERKAAEWVLSVDGAVQVVLPDEPDQAALYSNWTKQIPDGPFALNHVGLRTVQGFGDDDLANLRGCRRLQTLDLKGCRLNGSGLKHLAAVRSLTWLHFDHQSDQGEPVVTDETIAPIAQLTGLVVLDLGGNYRLTDAALAHVSGLKNLTGLGLSGCKFTDGGLLYLTELTRMNGIDLSDCPHLTDAGVQRLLEGRRHIVSLRIEHLKSKSQLTAASACGLERLTGLTLSANQLTAQSLPQLQQIQFVDLLQIFDPTDETLALACQLPTVVTVATINENANLSGCTTAGFQQLAKLPALQSLQLGGRTGSPSDEALLEFAKLPRLASFTLKYSVEIHPRNYTPAGIEKFRALRPDVEFNVDGTVYPATAKTP